MRTDRLQNKCKKFLMESIQWFLLCQFKALGIQHRPLYMKRVIKTLTFNLFQHHQKYFKNFSSEILTLMPSERRSQGQCDHKFITPTYRDNIRKMTQHICIQKNHLEVHRIYCCQHHNQMQVYKIKEQQEKELPIQPKSLPNIHQMW